MRTTKLVPTVILFACVHLSACSKKEEKDPPKEEMCSAVAKRTTDMGRAMLKGLGGDKVPASDWKLMDDEEKKLREQCMGWSDTAIRCAYRNDETSAECKTAMVEVKDSLSGAPPRAPEGPPIELEHAFTKAPDQLLLGPDGMAIALLEEELRAVRQDTVWKRDGKHRWMVLSKDEQTLFVGLDEKGVVALKAGTGEELYQVELPKKEDSGTEPRANVAALDEDGIVLGLYDGRLLRIDPAVCAKSPKEPSCISRLGVLTDERNFDSDGTFERMPDGRFLMRDYTGVYVVARDGTVEMDWTDWDMSAGARPMSSGDVVGNVDDRITMVSPKVCGKKEFMVMPKPKAGERCETCVDAPPGCSKWTWSEKDIEHREPTVLSDGSITIALDGDLALLEGDGKLRWRSKVGATGPALLSDGKLYVNCWGRDEEPAGICIVDPKDGKLQARTPFSKASGGWIYSVDNVWLEKRGPWLLAGVDKQLALIKL